MQSAFRYILIRVLTCLASVPKRVQERVRIKVGWSGGNFLTCILPAEKQLKTKATHTKNERKKCLNDQIT